MSNVASSPARLVLAFVLSVPFATSAVTAEAQDPPSCSVPIGSGELPRANDCLYILRSAVELEECDLCICDTNGDGQITAPDALRCLRVAVGLQDELECPACPVTTTTTLPDTTTTTLAPATTTTTISPATTTTTDAPTTTTTLLEACPVAVEWTTVASFGDDCVTNADCDAGACEDGVCRSASAIDIGWTGLGHGQDLNAGSVLRLRVDCPSEGPVCGSCTITGVDPSAGTCRCASDHRVACDEPFEADADCPGASACECFASAPYSISAGGTPICIVDRFASEPQGEVDVDLGTTSITATHRLRFYLGLGTRMPCPVCGGTCANDPARECVFDEDCEGGATCELDDTASDGVRGGTCMGGQNDGQTCDVTSSSTSFPVVPNAEGGAGYSLDCLPLVGANFTGAGLAVRVSETTGTSVLASELSCGFPNEELSCPCRLCSAEPNAACSSDEDCAAFAGNCDESLLVRCDENADCGAVDAGPCVSTFDRCQDATSVECTTNADCVGLDLGACLPSTCSVSSPLAPNSLPNLCFGFECQASPDGEAFCATGPDLEFCNALLTASGAGVLACTDDDDCEPSAIGVDGGTCTHVERLRCFPDPIVAEGEADPSAPLLATTYCAPATGGAGRNLLLGLPGPMRVVRQTTLAAYCGGDAGLYEPGVGGCLP